MTTDDQRRDADEQQQHRAGQEDDQAMYRRVATWAFRTAPSPEPPPDLGLRP